MKVLLGFIMDTMRLHQTVECLIKWHGHVSRCGKVFGTWERLGQKSFRSCTEVLMSWDSSFLLKGENTAAFLLETALRDRARELPANRLGYHFMQAYSEGWKEARPFLQPFKKYSNVNFDLSDFQLTLKMIDSVFWNHYHYQEYGLEA